MSSLNLFDDLDAGIPKREPLADGVVLLHHFALEQADLLLADMQAVIEQAPFRHLTTPGGLRMAVAMSNCGQYGWNSSRAEGYRYVRHDPDTGLPWPAMPASFVTLATRAAAEAGFEGFVPDACLINRYAAGVKLSLHQDKNERDFSAPIVSVSLGLPATFQLGGNHRQDRPVNFPLFHGDVLVWGGPARLRYHGVKPLAAGIHSKTGAYRINLTFRQAV